jgi:hypothetical protein
LNTHVYLFCKLLYMYVRPLRLTFRQAHKHKTFLRDRPFIDKNAVKTIMLVPIGVKRAGNSLTKINRG